MFNNVPLPWLLVIYFVLTGGIVFLAKKLADYTDALDKKTKISGAFIGTVFLAAVTSLPELFTSISATILLPDSADLVIGNILGSNLFNIAILGIAFIIFFMLIAKSNVEYKTQFITIAAILLIYGVIAYGTMAPSGAQPIFGPINLIVILIFGFYILAILLQPKSKEEGEEKIDPLPKLTVKQVVLRFILCAVLLIGISVVITYATDTLSELIFEGDDTVAGAIFLAIATSLPEVTSTIVLCRKGNFNAALGDITGSCLFNFLIIGLAEFMAFKTSLLRGFSPEYDKAILMVLLAVICFVFLFISLVIHRSLKAKEKPVTRWHYWLYVFTGIVMAAGYIVFLIL